MGSPNEKLPGLIKQTLFPKITTSTVLVICVLIAKLTADETTPVDNLYVSEADVVDTFDDLDAVDATDIRDASDARDTSIDSPDSSGDIDTISDTVRDGTNDILDGFGAFNFDGSGDGVIEEDEFYA